MCVLAQRSTTPAWTRLNNVLACCTQQHCSDIYFVGPASTFAVAALCPTFTPLLGRQQHNHCRSNSRPATLCTRNGSCCVDRTHMAGALAHSTSHRDGRKRGVGWPARWAVVPLNAQASAQSGRCTPHPYSSPKANRPCSLAGHKECTCTENTSPEGCAQARRHTELPSCQRQPQHPHTQCMTPAHWPRVLHKQATAHASQHVRTCILMCSMLLVCSMWQTCRSRLQQLLLAHANRSKGKQRQQPARCSTALKACAVHSQKGTGPRDKAIRKRGAQQWGQHEQGSAVPSNASQTHAHTRAHRGLGQYCLLHPRINRPTPPPPDPSPSPSRQAHV
jgi:hypothetical protein